MKQINDDRMKKVYDIIFEENIRFSRIYERSFSPIDNDRKSIKWKNQ